MQKTCASLDDILESEREYFDQKGSREEHRIIEDENWLILPEEHEATLRMWGLEGDLHGKRILECGAGTGLFSILLAKRGARVWCFDLSQKCVDIIRKRAKANGVGKTVHPEVAPFEDLKYEDESFDIIVGKNILHHIRNIEDAGKQLYRLLKPGGVGLFYELSAYNPFLIFVRNHVVGKAWGIRKQGTKHEHPLTREEVETLRRLFRGRLDVSHPKFRFFGKFDRQVFEQKYRIISWACESLDRMIYEWFPRLRKYSYKIMLRLTKPVGSEEC